MLPFAGTVGAGSSVLQFPDAGAPHKEMTLPLLPCGERIVVTYRVSGDSLKADGIRDGDYLVVKTEFERSELRADRLCVILLYGVELLCKYLIFEACGTVSLWSLGDDKKFYKQEVEPGAIEVLGLVVGSYHPRA